MPEPVCSTKMAYVFMRNVRHVFTQPTTATQVSLTLLKKQTASLEGISRCRCAASQKGLFSTFHSYKSNAEVATADLLPQQNEPATPHNTSNIKKKYQQYGIRTKDIHLQKFTVAIGKGNNYITYLYI